LAERTWDPNYGRELGGLFTCIEHMLLNDSRSLAGERCKKGKRRPRQEEDQETIKRSLMDYLRPISKNFSVDFSKDQSGALE
jgi:hypothetical protein